MTKRARNLIGIGIFLISMALVLLILVLTQPKNETEDGPIDSSTVSVLSYGRDDVATLTIKNENGEYTIRNGVTGFVIDEYAGFRQNSTTMGAAAKCAANITAQALVEENSQELDKYGLSSDAPKAQCDVVLKDGTSYSVYFGINSPDGKTRYVRLADSDDVYTVLLNSSGYFYYREEDFISLTVTDEISNNNVAPTLDHMTVTRKDLDYVIEFVDDSKNYDADAVTMASSQVMISPVYAYLDINNSNAIMYGLWGLSATGVVKVHPTEEDFKEYGLDDPFCEVNLDAELQNYNMKIGNVAFYELDENGDPTSIPAQFYCYYNGIDIIYTFASSEVPWATFKPIDILTSLMTGNYIYAVDYIDVNYYGNSPVHYYFDLDGSVEDAVLHRITIDGEDFDTEQFKKLYQFMLACPIDDLYFETTPPDEALVATIYFKCDDGHEDLLEFYDIGSNRVAIKLNGYPSFSQPIGYLNVLRQNIEAFKNGATGDELQTVW